jgi:RsmE family RNA methyltransferase
MNICLFTPEEIEKPLNIRDERAQHILKILHKKEGDTFAAGIIGSKAGTATITSIETHTVTKGERKEFEEGTLSFSFTAETDGKLLHPLIMLIGFPRPIQLKRLLRDMAGLGATAVYLTGTEFGEKSYLESDLAKTDSGYQMLLEGTEQAASTHIPALIKTATLLECLDEIEKHYTQNTKSTGTSSPALLALDNVNASGSLTHFLQEKPLFDEATKTPVLTVAAIGSERGWTKNERQLLELHGFTRLSMGNRVLRTETAATVAASLILSSMQALNDA